MDLISLENSVRYTPSIVEFPHYEMLKSQAITLADHISKIIVTEDNVKEVKKDLATIRKAVVELNGRRISVKKAILEPYTVFEKQVKEIDEIISDAESIVREQTRQLDEAERDKKCEEIRELWDKRSSQYTIAQYGDFFEKWLTPQHLNKSTTMKSIEDDMVDWLENREKDISTLSAMGAEYLVEYLKTIDMALAIATVIENETIKTAISSIEDSEESAIFIIKGKKNIKLAEIVLNENEIEYRRK